MTKKLDTDLYTIVEILNTGIDNFEIKSYQRGYRWDIDNIKTLIGDILECGANSVYCLQPIVVTKISASTYEVIDGQQRLTTFKILMHCLRSYTSELDIKDFNISYETRSCEIFLKKLYDNALRHELEDLTLEHVLVLWNQLTLEKEERNRDNFHIFQSYCTCHFELKRLDIATISSIVDKIRTQIKFIWYEVDLLLLNVTAEKLFANINKNKIKLTGADLIKALFILDIENNADNVEVKHFRKQNLANEWDEIEQSLRNPDFWFFITNSHNQHYDVRIGKLFDIVTENRLESDLGAYFIMSKDEDLRPWSLIYDKYRIAQEWFEDTYYYHRIGFLVNMDIHSFERILEEYTNGEITSKLKFKEWLDGEISAYFRSFEIKELLYSKQNDRGRYGRCTGVLLLYNILLTEKFYPGQKFSFGKFVEQEWSLEHIQPQNPKEKTAENWLEWLKEIKPLIVDKITDNEQLIIKVDADQYDFSEINYDELCHSLKPVRQTDKIPAPILKQLSALEDTFEEEFPVHGIQNLALLDKVTNSKLSNGSFKEKRALVLQMNDPESVDNEKTYLPLGTLNVFSKTMITDPMGIQLEYWSVTDSEFYEKDIKNTLAPYLSYE